MKAICATMTILLLFSGLAFAQGYGPGVNPSNPNDMTHRANPNDMTLPGAANPQDLARFPPQPQVVSPGLPRAIPSVPAVSSTLTHTHIDQPVKKFARRKHHVSEPRAQ
jgi:hypothetical protein